MYENIHVLDIRVNKFSRVPPRKYFNMNICQVEIIVHVLPIKRLLAYVCLFILLQKQLNAVKSVQCVTHCNQR